MMKKFSRHWLGLLAAFSLVFCAISAHSQSQPAQNNNDLQLELTAFKVTKKADGTESLTPTERLKPQETLEYQVKYHNKGDKVLRNVQATLPIPEALELLPGTAKPAKAWASIDGKTYAAIPLKRKVIAADGTEKIVPVPYAEYRFVRWMIGEIAPNQSVVVSARARLH
jgi:uncharacterized repeat protein (TIGR01451 family)